LNFSISSNIIIGIIPQCHNSLCTKINSTVVSGNEIKVFVPKAQLKLQFYFRLQIAALHFNENANRMQAVTKKEKDKNDVIFPKYKKGGYVVRKVTVEATYSKLNLTY
jgi:hypothetical protein